MWDTWEIPSAPPENNTNSSANGSFSILNNVPTNRGSDFSETNESSGVNWGSVLREVGKTATKIFNYLSTNSGYGLGEGHNAGSEIFPKVSSIEAKEAKYGLINSRPAGTDGPRITFDNDVPGGPSTYFPVDSRLRSAVENVARSTGMNFNINSTIRDSGPHAEGRAVDINRINAMRVDNPLNVDNVRALQEAFIKQPNVNQVLGPVHNVNKWYNAPQPSPSVIKAHRDHIHINVYP